VGSDDFKVYCLNATTGKSVWKYTTGTSIYSSPAVVGGYVYVASDSELYRLPMVSIGNRTPSFWDEYGLIIIISAIIAGVAIVVIAGAASKKTKQKKLKNKEIKKKKMPVVPSPAERGMDVEGLKAKPGKAQKSEDLITPRTDEEIAELRKTEREVTAQLDVKLCVVHKGPIKGANYVCPQCNTFYCLGCAATLASKGEGCWSCSHKIELDATLTAAGEKQFHPVAK
jgi:hypothetical protein